MKAAAWSTRQFLRLAGDHYTHVYNSQKKSIRVESRPGVSEPNMDVEYVVELSEDSLRAVVLMAHRNRNSIAVAGPVRVRVLRRTKV